LLPDSDPDLLKDLAHQVCDVLKAPLNTPKTGAPGITDLSLSTPMPLTSSDNLSFLVEIQHCHQTKEAEKGVRRTGMALSGGQSSASSDTHCVSVEPVSERRQLARKIHDIVKAVDGSEDVGTSTGLNRQVRWTKTPGLYSPAPSHLGSLTGGTGKSGNSANAMEAAQKAANMVHFQVCPLSVMDS
jgi:hypothetical protein